MEKGTQVTNISILFLFPSAGLAYWHEMIKKRIPEMFYPQFLVT